jgi:predicted P-loop ATPase
VKTEIAKALSPLLARVRTDVRGVKNPGGKPYKENKQLDLNALTHHANGGPAYGAYPIRPGESVCMMALFDLDSHKGETPWARMADVALDICNELDSQGLVPHPWRSSGGMGIHLLMTWATPQDARSVRQMLKDVLAVLGFKDGAGGVAKGEIEIFPKQDRVNLGQYGSYFFLPAAFESVPLDDFTFEPLGKEAIPDYVWTDSPDVSLAPVAEIVIQHCNVDVDLDEVASAVAVIPNTGEGHDYDTWFKVLAGIHACDPGEDGHEIAEAWSEQSSKHKRAWFEHTWSHLQSDRQGGVSVGTVFKLARTHGWDRYGPAVSVALDGIDVLAALSAIPAPPQPTPPTPQSAWPVFVVNRFGIPKAIITNVKMALENSLTSRGIQFGFDTFRDELMLAERPGQWRPITDVDLIRLRVHFESMQGGIPNIGREMMRDAVTEVAEHFKFDSAQVWLDKLKWDGQPRIERFFINYFGADDTSYVQATSLYTWTALAGRIIVPGIQADIMPILVGNQGLLKSTALAAMVPSHDFFAEINLSDKDADLARTMRGKLVVEIGELKGMRSREIEHTKAFVTRRHEQWVPKYKEFTSTYPRRSVLFGTTNEDEFLEDATGARRFNPINVRRAERRAIKRDRLQLWAEAKERFEQDLALGGDGVIWQEAERLARAVHEEFTVDDPWTEDVSRWLNERDDLNAPFSSVDCLKGALLLPGNQLHTGSKKRLALILKRLGYDDGRQYIDGRRARVWMTRDGWAAIGTLKK